MKPVAPIRWIHDCAMWLWDPFRNPDRRRHVRLPAEVEVEITLRLGTVQGRSSNVSKGGASVLVPEAMTCGAVVFVRFPTIDRSAFAQVRRCAAHEQGFQVALQFRDGLALDDRAMTGFDYHRATGLSDWN